MATNTNASTGISSGTGGDRDFRGSLYDTEGGSNYLSAKRYAEQTGHSNDGRSAEEMWGPKVHASQGEPHEGDRDTLVGEARIKHDEQFGMRGAAGTGRETIIDRDVEALKAEFNVAESK